VQDYLFLYESGLLAAQKGLQINERNIVSVSEQTICVLILYILESNPQSFYSFRGLKNQMRIITACGLDLRSRAGLWKNDRAAVRAVRTIQ
jgi:hypothetical protein